MTESSMEHWQPSAATTSLGSLQSAQAVWLVLLELQSPG
jgi:hypothetical protein